jgi:hypothetical protein
MRGAGSDFAPVFSLLEKQLERSLEGWARMSTEGAWHYYRRFLRKDCHANMHYLKACSHCSLLPIYGARLKKREDLPEGAVVCSDCERTAR